MLDHALQSQHSTGHREKSWLCVTYTQIAFRRRTDVGCWSQGRQILPTLGRRRLANHYSSKISQYFADVGPTADFCSRWRRAIIGDLGKLRKKLFIMVCLKIIFQ